MREQLEHDEAGKITSGRSIAEFVEAHPDRYPYPAEVLAAGRRLEAHMRLFQLGSGNVPGRDTRWGILATEEELRPDLEYGTFDFIVGGLPAVVDRFAESVKMLTVTNIRGDVDAGSAFVLGDVSSGQVLVTAAHVVAGMTSTKLTLGVRELEVGPWHLLPYDIAVARTPQELDCPGLRVAGNPARLDEVVTLGYPKLPFMEPALMSTAGEIAGSSTHYGERREYLLTTCAMTGGSSGGPGDSE